jgi:putative hemolysin
MLSKVMAQQHASRRSGESAIGRMRPRPPAPSSLRVILPDLLVVVDEHGSVEGIVTEGDVLKSIVADIDEEAGPRIVERGDGSLLSDGAFPVDKAGHRLGIALPPSHDYHTVAGFVLDRMRRLPRVGEVFQYGGWRFEIVDVDGRRIDKVMAARGTLLHRGQP